jgi:hypothetical protein
MSDYPLTEHTLSHIISELTDWQMERQRELTSHDIEEQLKDAGYGSACFEQVAEAWFETLEARRFTRTPITRDIHAFGEATTTVVPNETDGTERRGVGIRIHHPFLDPTEPGVLVSTDEALSIAEDIRRAAMQTEGRNPDEPTKSFYEQLLEHLGEDGDYAWIYAAVQDAFAREPEAVRGSITAALCGLYEQLKDSTIPEMMYDLTGDVLGLADDLELDR